MWLLLAVTVFQTFPIFHEFDSFEEYCSGILRMHLYWSYYYVFLMIGLMLCFGGRIPYHFHHIIIKGTYYQLNLYTVNVDLGHMTEAVFVRFLYCKAKLFPHFPYCALLEGSHYEKITDHT